MDEWTRRRPPGVHVERRYPSGELLQRLPERIKADPRVALFTQLVQEYGDSIVGTTPGSTADVRIADAGFFDELRQRLLDGAAALFQPLLEARDPSVKAEAHCLAAYNLLQYLLWCGQVGSREPLQLWELVRSMADAGVKGVLSAPEPVDERVDLLIRAMLASGRAAISLNTPNGPMLLFAVVCVYLDAEALGFKDVVEARQEDFILALYSIIDFGVAPADSMWMGLASCLLKRRTWPIITPPVRLGVTGHGRLILKSGAPAPALVHADYVNVLPRGVAVLDVVITQRKLWINVSYRDRSRQFRRDHPQSERSTPLAPSVLSEAHAQHLAEGVVTGTEQWIVPEASFVEPRTEHWIIDHEQGLGPGARALSQRIAWVGLRQIAEVSWGHEGWEWNAQWKELWGNHMETLFAAIYREVVGPASEMLANEEISHLVVVSDGSLMSVPFHVLRDEAGVRLQERYAVSYAVSRCSLRLPSPEKPVGDAHIVVVEDPSESIALADWECTTITSHADQRARYIRARDATRDAITEACRGADVLHFTGHAQFSPMDMEDTSLQIRDGVLGMTTLRNLQFAPGALVYLSACHTARQAPRGKRVSAEGLVGALMDAGAATVICTLWPADSYAAALTAAWFYEALWRGGRSRMASLRVATERLRTTTTDEGEAVLGTRIRLRGTRPFEDEYFWGGFVLYGAW
jgi:hypothetical protein